MSGANNVQASKTPRARHNQSRSGVAPASDSDGTIMQSAGGKKKGSRRNNQARNDNIQQAPAWQDNNPQQPEGFFDAHGNFVTAQQYYNGQIAGGAYVNSAQNIHGAQNSNRKQQNSKNWQNGTNGTETPPPALSDSEQIQAANVIYNMTPAKSAAAAYAGPTFHASPAPSALPMPKFFSKSVPSDPAQAGLQARLDQETEKNDNSDQSESPTITAAPAIAVPDRSGESPLDFLFKADKEQKAKRQSASYVSTPPAKPTGYFPGIEPAKTTEPAKATSWQTIYGTASRNHQRQASNGSGKDMFMLELDASESSPRAKHLSPPSLPRLPIRSVSDQNVTQLPANSRTNAIPRPNFYSGGVNGNSMPSLQPSASDPRPFIDSTHSPFNRPGPYPTPRSADSTPQPHQNGVYNTQNSSQNGQHNLHYGNRNLSPLFKAAKQDSVHRTSSLRQEVLPSYQVSELPDSSPSRPSNGVRRTSSKADQAAMAFLQTQVPTPPSMPHIPLPRASPLPELDGQPSTSTPTQGTTTKAFNAKSAEDDLKRLLKLTGGVK